jgi:hypothetical protein
MHVEEIAAITVDCGLTLHKDVGPGLLESAYENMLMYLLELRGLRVERLLPIHKMQVVTYLRFLNLSLGLLMNFSSEQFKTGLMRVVNDHSDVRGSSLRMHQ